MNHIKREIVDGKFCVLRFDQADAKANLFNLETLAELDGHVRDIAADRAIQGVVLISAKERVFHAGADLRALQKGDADQLRVLLERGQKVFNHLAALEAATVAAIHGVCMGGGYELSLACDYRIATSDRVTKIGLPETKLGLLPAWGGSTRLPRLVGVVRALDIILAGKTPAAKQALRYGMIDAIAPRELLLSAALGVLRRGPLPPRRGWRRHPLCNRLLSSLIAPMARAKTRHATRSHYPAVLKACDVVLAAAGSSIPESLERERRGFFEVALTGAGQNLLRLFFLQERLRKPEGKPTKPIEHAAVIGAGVMGSGIAQWLASRGVRVILRDIDPKFVAAGMERIRKLFGNRRVFTALEARDGLDRISPTVLEPPLQQVDLVIEAAVEKMVAKKQIFAELDRQAVRPDTLLATNTSALSLAEIAGATKNPGRVVGIHFFNPVHKMQLVEVVAGAQADPEAVRRAVHFAQKIGKLPVVVKDSPGFLVNRILLPYLLEAGLLFESGAPVFEIDEAMLDFGMPMGPLRLIDEVGVDIAEDVAETLAAKFGDRLSVPALLPKMVAAGWLGRKSGRGFYRHSGSKAILHEDVNHLCQSRAAAMLNRSALQQRLVLLLINEAARCVEEQISSGPDMVDFAMVMGTGFAPFRGGPLRYADALGLAEVVKALDRLTAEAGPRYAPCALLKQLAAEGKRFYAD